MPTPTKAWTAKDGTLHPTPEMAGRRDLFNIISDTQDHLESQIVSHVIDALTKNADTVVAALTTGPTSRPSARKRAGTTAPKRAAKRATEAQATAGFKAMRQATEGGTNATHDADVPAEPAAV